MEPLDQIAAEEATSTKREQQPVADMPFLDHLDELRGVLIRSAIVFIVASTGLMFFIRQIADILNWPLHVALGDQAGKLIQNGLITNGPLAVFGVLFQVSFFGGFAISLPFILYFVARFIAPGLTPRELRLLRPLLAAAFILFLTGAAFSFFLLCPATLKASFFFNSLFDFQVLWTADKYYSFLVWSTLGVGVLFEFPLLIVGLTAAGVVKVEQLRQYRSHSIVAILVLSAMITPTTDPVTFLLLGVPMYFLYEGAIFVSLRIEGRRPLPEIPDDV